MVQLWLRRGGPVQRVGHCRVASAAESEVSFVNTRCGVDFHNRPEVTLI